MKTRLPTLWGALSLLVGLTWPTQGMALSRSGSFPIDYCKSADAIIVGHVVAVGPVDAGRARSETGTLERARMDVVRQVKGHLDQFERVTVRGEHQVGDRVLLALYYQTEPTEISPPGYKVIGAAVIPKRVALPASCMLEKAWASLCNANPDGIVYGGRELGRFGSAVDDRGPEASRETAPQRPTDASSSTRETSAPDCELPESVGPPERARHRNGGPTGSQLIVRLDAYQVEIPLPSSLGGLVLPTDVLSMALDYRLLYPVPAAGTPDANGAAR